MNNSISAEKTRDKVQPLSMIKSNEETKDRRDKAWTGKVVGHKPIFYCIEPFS